MRMRRFAPGSALLVSVTALVVAPSVTFATTPDQAITLYNAQREANEIPGVAVHTSALDDGCAKHVDYMKLNGIGHGEDPGKPGYTPEGAGLIPDSSGNEVLAGGYLPWSTARNPWEDAPGHLFLMFKPDVAKVGYAEDGFACMRMKMGPPDLTPGPHLYSYPGPDQSVFPELDASGEMPSAPQDLVGLSDRVTGPDIAFYADGLDPGGDAAPTLRAVSYGLVGPDGPVPALMVDGAEPEWGNVGGGMMIAVDPLRPFASYTASVTWRYGAGATVEQVVPFRTRGHQNDMEMRLEPDGDRRLVEITLTTAVPVTAISEPSIAPNLDVTLTGPGGRTLHPRWDDNSQGDFFPGSNTTVIVATGLARGPWTACAHSGGVEVGYEDSTDCGEFTIGSLVERPAISKLPRRKRLGSSRWVKVALVRCPPGGERCRLDVPRRVRARSSSEHLRIAVRAPATVGAGQAATVELRSAPSLRRALRGARARARVPITITKGADRVHRVVSVTLEGARVHR